MYLKDLSRIDLGDQRLNEWSVKQVKLLSAKPTASIPAACRGWAETVAAYRFLAQDEIEWSDIVHPHLDCSLTRMRSHPVVLCIHDTTELDFNGRGAESLGLLSYETQRGMFLHPTLCSDAGPVTVGCAGCLDVGVRSKG